VVASENVLEPEFVFHGKLWKCFHEDAGPETDAGRFAAGEGLDGDGNAATGRTRLEDEAAETLGLQLSDSPLGPGH
jgi:hypothetical protein